MSNAEKDKNHGRIHKAGSLLERSPEAASSSSASPNEPFNGTPSTRAQDARNERIQRAWLSRGLRELFQDTASEAIPDNFVNLLEELEQAERQKNKAEGDG